jgi:hypothetical protein
MKPLQPAGLASFLAAGAVLGLTAAQLATGLGYSFPLSPWSMILMLPLIGVAIYLATLPIYRYRKSLEKWESGPRPSRPNPFFAFRALVISRAIALTAALFAGWYLGGLIWLVSFSIAPSGLTTPTVFGAVGSLVMLGGGLGGRIQLPCTARA